MHQPLIPGCLIIKFTITQNAQYRNHFHNVLCLSEAKGMDINMIFCGDAAMNGVPSLHRITIWIENKKEFENSWQVLLSENVEYIYPAHGKRFKSSDLHKFKAKINKIKLYPLK